MFQTGKLFCEPIFVLFINFFQKDTFQQKDKEYQSPHFLKNIKNMETCCWQNRKR